MKKASQLLKFTQVCLRLATQQVPLYSSPFSKHPFWDRSYASRYYTQRIKLQIRALKTALLGDTRAQTVLDLHVTTTRQHDTRIAPQLTERNLERFEALAADKGYDDQEFPRACAPWGASGVQAQGS